MGKTKNCQATRKAATESQKLLELDVHRLPPLLLLLLSCLEWLVVCWTRVIISEITSDF